MSPHKAFASDEFLRYAAECKRMAQLSAPARGEIKQLRNLALLPLWLVVVGNAIMTALN